MTFIAACPFCGRRVQAADSALGQSVACRKCQSYYTLAPLDDLDRTAAALGPPPAEPAATPADTSLPQPAEPGEGREFQFAPLPPLPETAPPAKAEAPAATARPWNPLAVLALVLGSGGLAVASFPPLQWTSIALTGAGCATALLCLVVLPPRRLRDVAVWSAAGLVSAGTLVTALCWPNLLGVESVFGRRSEDEPEPNRQVYCERADRHNVLFEPKTEPLAPGQWIDAREYEIQHGVVRLRILMAALLERREPKRKEPRKELEITVELAHAGYRTQVIVSKFAAGAAPALTDPEGKSFPYRPTAADKAAGRRRLRPLAPEVETLIFEAPATLPEWLRLELPAAAFGGLGSVRFEIPRSMIVGIGGA